MVDLYLLPNAIVMGHDPAAAFGKVELTDQVRLATLQDSLDDSFRPTVVGDPSKLY